MLGIISDTHDNIPTIKKAVEIFKEKGVSLVLHLGDIVAPGTVLYFKGFKIKFIKGNCDGDIEHIKQKINEINGEFLGVFAEIELRNKKIALMHRPDRLNKLILTKKYDYILYGHTHQEKNEKIGKTRIINPGSLYLGNKKHSIALLDLQKDEVEFICIK